MREPFVETTTGGVLKNEVMTDIFGGAKFLRFGILAHDKPNALNYCVATGSDSVNGVRGHSRSEFWLV